MKTLFIINITIWLQPAWSEDIWGIVTRDVCRGSQSFSWSWPESMVRQMRDSLPGEPRPISDLPSDSSKPSLILVTVSEVLSRVGWVQIGMLLSVSFLTNPILLVSPPLWLNWLARRDIAVASRIGLLSPVLDLDFLAWQLFLWFLNTVYDLNCCLQPPHKWTSSSSLDSQVSLCFVVSCSNDCWGTR